MQQFQLAGKKTARIVGNLLASKRFLVCRAAPDCLLAGENASVTTDAE